MPLIVHVAVCLKSCQHMDSCNGLYIEEGRLIKKTRERRYHLCANYEGPPPQALLGLFF